jgi:hypothetical protein
VTVLLLRRRLTAGFGLGFGLGTHDVNNKAHYWN